MIHDKNKLTPIQELARKILTNWKFDTYDLPWQTSATYHDVDEECYFEVTIVPQSNNTFNVCVDTVITSCVRWKVNREFYSEEELIQYLKKLNTVNGLTMDALKDELAKPLGEYCNQIL